VSRTRDIVQKITQIIQDIGLICRNKNTKQTTKGTRLGGKEALDKRTRKWICTDVQSGADDTRSADSKCTSLTPDPPSIPDSPARHDPTPHASPALHSPVHHSPIRTHTCPEASLSPASAAFEPGKSGSTGDTAVQYESSDSCTTSLMTSPPSEELEQDSREGIEGEEPPNPGGVRGTTGED
jgi:hypothetical protein